MRSQTELCVYLQKAGSCMCVRVQRESCVCTDRSTWERLRHLRKESLECAVEQTELSIVDYLRLWLNQDGPLSSQLFDVAVEQTTSAHLLGDSGRGRQLKQTSTNR